MNKSTVWNRGRVSALLIVGGVVGLLIAGLILRLPLLVAIVLAILIGTFGAVGAILEMIVKAIARSRAPITFRGREPYEFIKTDKGYINLAHVTYVHCNKSGSVKVCQSDGEPLTLEHDEAVLFAALLDEFATPLRPLAQIDVTEPAEPVLEKIQYEDPF